MGLKSLMFGGVDSLDYGVGITGAGVYSAPERDVEIIEVAGRNGAYIMDNGRFNNIEVIYNAVMGAATQEGFAKKLSDFRNVMLSQVGYQRLEDEYNTDEFRLGAYIGGMNVNPAANSMAGDFELRFNCKPQRYLKSGENSIDITSGDKLINPTPFDALPLIIITADDEGAVYVNEKPIIYSPDNFGDLALANTRPYGGAIGSGAFSYSTESVWGVGFYNNGDTISASGDIYIRVDISGFPSIEGANIGGITGANLDYISYQATTDNIYSIAAKIPKSVLTFKAGTKKTINFELYGIIEYKTGPASDTYGAVLDFSGTVKYGTRADGSTDYNCITFEHSGEIDPLEQTGQALTIDYTLENFPPFSVYSTKSAFAGEVYFDCETYEAYTYVNGDKVYINNQISAGAGFPVLKSGENGVSFFGGVQTCKIIPRWWLI